MAEKRGGQILAPAAPAGARPLIPRNTPAAGSCVRVKDDEPAALLQVILSRPSSPPSPLSSLFLSPLLFFLLSPSHLLSPADQIERRRRRPLPAGRRAPSGDPLSSAATPEGEEEA